MKEAQDGPVKKWFKPQMGIFTDVSAGIKQILDFIQSIAISFPHGMTATALINVIFKCTEIHLTNADI